MTKQFLLLSLLLLPLTSVGSEGFTQKLNTPLGKALVAGGTGIVTIGFLYKAIQYATAKEKSVDEIMDEFKDVGKKQKQ